MVTYFGIAPAFFAETSTRDLELIVLANEGPAARAAVLGAARFLDKSIAHEICGLIGHARLKRNRRIPSYEIDLSNARPTRIVPMRRPFSDTRSLASITIRGVASLNMRKMSCWSAMRNIANL